MDLLKLSKTVKILWMLILTMTFYIIFQREQKQDNDLVEVEVGITLSVISYYYWKFQCIWWNLTHVTIFFQSGLAATKKKKVTTGNATIDFFMFFLLWLHYFTSYKYIFENMLYGIKLVLLFGLVLWFHKFRYDIWALAIFLFFVSQAVYFYIFLTWWSSTILL